MRILHARQRSFEAARALELRCNKTAFDRDSRRESVQSATRNSESAASEPAARGPAPAQKRAKLSVLLITRDEQLWPQVGAHLGKELILKQVDSIDELLTATPSGQPAIVLLD